MISRLFGNFGIRNSVHNGQTQKTLQIAELLDRLNSAPVARIDTTNFPIFCLKYMAALITGQVVGLCLGPKGLAFIAGLDDLLSPVVGKARPVMVIFAVGGWLKDLAARNGAVRRLCWRSRVLVETPGLRAELAAIGVEADTFPNFRDLPVAGTEPVPPGPEGLRLIYCGRISADKGYREAIALADRLTEMGQKTHLQFYGPVLDRDFPAEVESRDHVSYHGTYDDPKEALKLMGKHHFVVLPSRYPGECVPGALVEAKFAGLPAIVTDWRFLSEVVSDGQTGFVCALPGFVKEAADKVALTTGDDYLDMSRACSREAEAIYSIEAAKARLGDLLAFR